MKAFNAKQKNLAKTALAAAVMIGSTTALFQGLTQAAAASEIGKKDIVPTSYIAAGYPTADTSPLTQQRVPEGYKKANYTLVDNDLEYYRDKKPTDKDISREAAAEIGAQGLWQVYNLDLEGKELEMAYNPATKVNRAIWEGRWWIDGKGKSTQQYFFSVDAITGELFSVQYNRTLKENTSVGFDGALAKNPQEYEALAKSVAEKYNLVHGLVKSIEYANQGYSGNDPTIDVRILGENGEQAQITFSRHDKALLGIAYDAWCKEADAIAKKIEEEMKEEVSIHYEITELLLSPKP